MTEILPDWLFGVSDVSGETLCGRDILWTRHRPHLGAVDRHDVPADEPFLPAELHEGRAGGDDRLRILAKVESRKVGGKRYRPRAGFGRPARPRSVCGEATINRHSRGDHKAGSGTAQPQHRRGDFLSAT